MCWEGEDKSLTATNSQATPDAGAESGLPGVAEEVVNVADMTLLDFARPFPPKRLQTRGSGVEAQVTAAGSGLPAGHVAGKVLRVRLGKAPDASISLLAPARGWDLSKRVSVALDIANAGPDPITVRAWLNDKDWIDGFVVLAPGQHDRLEIILKRTRYYAGMLGLPGGHLSLWEQADPAHVSRISMAAVDSPIGCTFEVKRVRARGHYVEPPEGGINPQLCPFVDRYGQYEHQDWPGKTHSDSDLAAQREQEDRDLGEHSGASEWNGFGGWTAGPRFEATGHFRTWKHDGKWWLLDPEGCLFWSHGVDCVGSAASTRVEGRECYFEGLDERFRMGAEYDFSAANHFRKYGSAWEERAVERAHRRLRSWGMNTVANWSDEPVCLARKTPYLVGIHYYSAALGELPYRDLEAFRQALRDCLAAEQGKTSDDPWCIGYFVDNELRWPQENAAPFAQAYHSICREEVKRVAPHKLYLGSRLHDHLDPLGGPAEVVRAAAEHCDVISVNRYRFTPSDLTMLAGEDKPLIIGEFHFGALDRGLLHTGLRSVSSQDQRAAAYQHYVRQALRHPHIVGTHWFQYRDQAVTGRSDGENYQIGLVDICDTPYAETVAASRAVGYDLYRIRAEG